MYAEFPFVPDTLLIINPRYATYRRRNTDIKMKND
jgi:hypothetical protein